MKGRKGKGKKGILLLLSAAMMLMLGGCMDPLHILLENSRQKKEEITYDQSDNSYQTEHFNGSLQERRTYTATNGKEIYYQDGADIRRHSDGEIIREEMKAICMAGIEKGLLYVSEEGELWLYEQKTEENRRIDQDKKVASALWDGKYVFIIYEDEEIRYTAEEDIENTAGYTAVKAEPEEKIREYRYGEDTVYNTFYEKKIGETYLLITEREDGTVYTVGFFLNQRYAGADHNQPATQIPQLYYNEQWYENGVRSIELLAEEDWEQVINAITPIYSWDNRNTLLSGEKLYYLTHGDRYGREEWFSPGHDTYEIKQKFLVSDRIEVYNLETFEGGVVYETKDNWERIIGYDGRYVYLLDVKTFRIDRYDTETGERKYWDRTEGGAELRFEWCGDSLFIYDTEYNCVDILNAM